MNRYRAWGLVLLGWALIILGNMRWGVGALAWVAPIPLLLALRERTDWRFRAAFALGTVAAWSVATMKIVSPPMPYVMAIGFGTPVALVHLPAYALWDRLVRRGHDTWAVFAFASATALLEWAQAELTPLAVWGAAPVSQVGNAAVLQTLALAGLPGLSFWMGVVAAGAEGLISRRLSRRFGLGLVAASAALLVWGQARSVAPFTGPEVRAAMVRTDSTVAGLPLPSDEVRRRDTDTLFARTSDAARAGAELIVWPEGSNVVLPEEEPALVARAAAAAREQGVDLVVSYISPVSMEPLRYENRARWFAPSGEEKIQYLKAHPVPGEPAVPGEGPAAAIDTAFGKATLAICYDYDFPALGRAHARSGAGIVALPSSDWRGIDPIHTEMAAMRAVEGGFSIVRSTRFGLSGAVDPHGRLRAQMSTNESSAPFLMASVPTAQLPTLYAYLGNGVLVPLGAIVLLAILRVVARRREERGAPPLGRTIGAARDAS